MCLCIHVSLAGFHIYRLSSPWSPSIHWSWWVDWPVFIRMWPSLLTIITRTNGPSLPRFNAVMIMRWWLWWWMMVMVMVMIIMRWWSWLCDCDDEDGNYVDGGLQWWLGWGRWRMRMMMRIIIMIMMIIINDDFLCYYYPIYSFIYHAIYPSNISSINHVIHPSIYHTIHRVLRMRYPYLLSSLVMRSMSYAASIRTSKVIEHACDLM
jgi:hypothetical protein